MAAIALGEEGADTLLSIAERSEGEETRPARALRALSNGIPAQRLVDLLNEALRRRRHLVAEAAIEVLGARHDPSLTGRLAAVLMHGTETLCLAACNALLAAGDSAAEAALVSTLRSEWSSVRVAAADALGAIGTVAAVGPLQAAATSGESGLRAAAQQAIARIQSRVPGADHGQLSLADGSSGQVSLADDERGRVTLARDP